MNLEDSCFIEQGSKKVLISLHILDWERIQIKFPVFLYLHSGFDAVQWSTATNAEHVWVLEVLALKNIIT